MLAPDITFADSQGLYRALAEVTCREDDVFIDLSKVDAAGAVALKNEFWVSCPNGVEPAAIEGGTLALYETKKDFRTYRITRTGGSRVVIRCTAG